MAAIGCLQLPVGSLSLSLAGTSRDYGRFGNNARPHCFPVLPSCSVRELMPPKVSRELKLQTGKMQTVQAVSLLGSLGAPQTFFLQSFSPLLSGRRQASCKHWRSRAVRAESAGQGRGNFEENESAAAAGALAGPWNRSRTRVS